MFTQASSFKLRLPRLRSQTVMGGKKRPRAALDADPLANQQLNAGHLCRVQEAMKAIADHGHDHPRLGARSGVHPRTSADLC
eukprot:10647686-Alexandrium_andersonii.AAC.1